MMCYYLNAQFKGPRVNLLYTDGWRKCGIWSTWNSVKFCTLQFLVSSEQCRNFSHECDCSGPYCDVFQIPQLFCLWRCSSEDQSVMHFKNMTSSVFVFDEFWYLWRMNSITCVPKGINWMTDQTKSGRIKNLKSKYYIMHNNTLQTEPLGRVMKHSQR